MFVYTGQLHAQSKKPVNEVNVFIGTGKAGNTYPGAQAPFGMISLSPSTTFDNYDSVEARPGYKYNRDTLRGFSLTHFSGVGCHAMQDVLFFPTTLSPDSSPVNNKNAYTSHFSHTNEKASPGFYQVFLEDSQILSSFTATQRSGRCTFTNKNSKSMHIIFEPGNSANGISDGNLHFEPQQKRISGFVKTGGFCWRDPSYLPYEVYFVAEFDSPYTNYGVWKNKTKKKQQDTISGKEIAGYITFPASVKEVKMKVAISFVSVRNALLNLEKEVPGWSFEQTRKQTRKSWASYLNRIKITGGKPDERVQFYTSVYHNLLQPNVFEDVNGEYIGFDDKIHVVPDGRHKYVNFSLWDTYRTSAALQAMLAPKESSDMVQSLLFDAQQGGAFPNWSMNNQEYGVMNGYSVFPFIASMYAFGARDFDLQAVKDMMKKVSASYYGCRDKHGWLNIEDYKNLGYVPVDKNQFGTSMTMEYGIDDYAIAQICKAADDTAYNYYLKRSQNVFHLYHSQNRLLQGKNSNGQFISPFDKTTQTGFNEGNAIQYFWSVPHSMQKLIEIAGGKTFIDDRLDTFMSKIEIGWAPEKPYYWLGNEPCFGTAYVYNYLQKPWKTQYQVRHIINKYFNNSPDGMAGDDDVGSMSALYTFSALGLYPYIPGKSEWMLSGPLFKKTIIHLQNGKDIKIKAIGAGAYSPYIKFMSINGRPVTNLWLNWNKVNNGAYIKFKMSTTKTNWGTSISDTPPSYYPN